MGWNFSQLSPQLQRRIVADGLPLPNKLGQPAQPVKVKGVMNGLEKEFYVSNLSVRFNAGEFVSIDYEGTTLPLAYRMSYTPDFDCRTGTGLQVFFEVKAPHRFRTAGMHKLKFAAQTYPEAEFYLAEKKNKEWKITRVQRMKAPSVVSPYPTEEDED